MSIMVFRAVPAREPVVGDDGDDASRGEVAAHRLSVVVAPAGAR